MRVQEITPGFKNYFKKTELKQNSQIYYQNQTDVFVKQSPQISFTGTNKKDGTKNDGIPSENIKSDIGDSLKNIGIKGAPFLLGVALSAGMVKLGDAAKDVFMDEGGYLVTDDGMQSSLINIDADDEIIRFEGTGVDIDASKIDYVDWSNGIFKNRDGSIDIDLGNNKFIDKINGIFVDPAEKISAVLDNGRMQSMAIPKFNPVNFKGYQTWPYPVIHSGSDAEEAGTFDMFKDFIKGLFGKDTMPTAEGVKDIFDNPIIMAKDDDGDTYMAPYFKELQENPVFSKIAKSIGTENAVEKVNCERVKQYIEAKHPSFGTRVLTYEGGRNATGVGGYYMPFEITDDALAQKTLAALEADKDYLPEQGSEEAINFAKYQTRMLKLRGWKEPKIDPNLLLGKNTDLDNDGIPDYDRNGDGKINYSTKEKRGLVGAAKAMFEVADKDGSGTLSMDEITDFMSQMDANGDGKISLGEIINFFMGFFNK